jgi:hypothetical protein
MIAPDNVTKKHEKAMKTKRDDKAKALRLSPTLTCLDANEVPGTVPMKLGLTAIALSFPRRSIVST